MDALSRTLRNYPVPGKVIQVVTDSLTFLPGGGAGNASAALAQMGLPVSVFSKVGDDPNGRFLIDSLRGHGVDTAGICVSAGDTTAFTYVAIHPDGDRTFIHTPGANKTFCLADLDRRKLLQTDFLLYQDLWVLPALDGRPGASLLAEARGRGVVTLLDQCWGLGPDAETWETMLPHADYVLPSLAEVQAVYPGRPAEELAELFCRKGAGCVVLKMGKDGCLVARDGQFVRVESRAERIVDTTGAGDCFNAGFVAGLARDLTPVEAARLGSLAAAACIRHVGGAVGIPPLESLLADL